MCSMEYYSRFSATWNGQKMKIEQGTIKVPEELEKYIKQPIEYVKIRPYDITKYENGERNVYYRFKTDTLKSNQTYNLRGEIIGINNSVPVLKVKIK